MTILWAALVVVVVAVVAVGAMLLVRRRAPDGSYFEDGDLPTLPTRVRKQLAQAAASLGTLVKVPLASRRLDRDGDELA